MGGVRQSIHDLIPEVKIINPQRTEYGRKSSEIILNDKDEYCHCSYFIYMLFLNARLLMATIVHVNCVIKNRLFAPVNCYYVNTFKK